MINNLFLIDIKYGTWFKFLLLSMFLSVLLYFKVLTFYMTLTLFYFFFYKILYFPLSESVVKRIVLINIITNYSIKKFIWLLRLKLFFWVNLIFIFPIVSLNLNFIIDAIIKVNVILSLVSLISTLFIYVNFKKFLKKIIYITLIQLIIFMTTYGFNTKFYYEILSIAYVLSVVFTYLSTPNRLHVYNIHNYEI